MDDIVARIHDGGPSVGQLRVDLASRIAQGITALRHYLGTWEKRYLVISLGSLAMNRASGQDSTAWLLHSVTAFEKAFTSPEDRVDFEDAEADQVTYVMLQQAAQALGAH